MFNGALFLKDPHFSIGEFNTIMQNRIKDHAALSGIFNEDESRVNWHDETLWFVRKKRDQAAQSIPEWEQLTELGSQMKNDFILWKRGVSL